ncbi:hypothetical protein BCON_0075g00050 [Botryotinia convoluta]|uniref:HIT domain-containing protein n=1 Tax=Botryotinia convoluta TaxID=54673 RepID=A0A4Z1I5M9_9HELO|nr:hypothetical protein BCON_0075g00050 [Botryotinia convoluta]
MASQAACIFCKIIKGKFLISVTSGAIPKLDAKANLLVIPKHHGEKLVDIPDDQLEEILPVVKKLVVATGAENYNVLQNNGRIAHQEVDHIPKPSTEEGMSIGWPQQQTDMDKLKALFAEIKAKM